MARLTTDEKAPLTFLQMELVRTACWEQDVKHLRQCAADPCWRVSQQAWVVGYSIPLSNNTSLTWQLSTGGVDGQQTIASLTQYLSKSNRHSIPTPLAPRHPWQMGMTLPNSVTIDLSQHQPSQLPCQDGRQVMRRNGRVWIAKETKNIIMLDAALQEPPPKRRSAPKAQANNLWTQWRNLAQHGRRGS